MYLWFTTTTMTIFITSITSSITIAIVLCCAMKKPKRPYKPGHLPEFLDPSAKEADTYYGMRSTVAFPVKDTEIKRKDDINELQAEAEIGLNLEAKKQVPNREIQPVSTPV